VVVTTVIAVTPAAIVTAVTVTAGRAGRRDRGAGRQAGHAAWRGDQRLTGAAPRLATSTWTLFAAPALSVVVLTEVNPGYDPAGDLLARYTEAVTSALAAGLMAA
jgi:hypothetical protein